MGERALFLCHNSLLGFFFYSVPDKLSPNWVGFTRMFRILYTHLLSPSHFPSAQEWRIRSSNKWHNWLIFLFLNMTWLPLFRYCCKKLAFSWSAVFFFCFYLLLLISLVLRGGIFCNLASLFSREVYRWSSKNHP